MRVVLIASAPPPALELSSSLANLGHDVAALVSFRGPEGRYGSGYPSALHAGAPDGDLLFVRSGDRLGSLLRSYEPDVALCASFPARIPDEALAAPRHGILNVHPSLLPRYRGPNPLGWAIRNGDPEIGITVHRMTSEMDSGPIYAQSAVPVPDDADPAVDGLERFQGLANRLVAEALARVTAGIRATLRTKRRRPTPGSSSPPTSRSTGRTTRASSTTRPAGGRCRRPSAVAAARSRSSMGGACGCCARSWTASAAAFGSTAATAPCGCSTASRSRPP